MRPFRTAFFSSLILATAFSMVATNVAAAGNVRPIPRFSAGGWARDAQLAANDAGVATAVWDTGKGVVQSATFDGVMWSCPVTLPRSTNPALDAGWPWDLAVAGNGNAVFGGALTNEGIAVWTRVGQKGAWKKVRWANPRAVGVREDHGPPTVALTGDSAVVAWVAGNPGDGSLAVYGAQIPINSTAPVNVTTIFAGSVGGQNPEVAADAQGNGFVMVIDGDTDITHLRQITWPKGGTPTTVRTIDRAQSGVWSMSAHANANGQLVAMWTEIPADSDNLVNVKVATGAVTSGISSESVWTTNNDLYITHALWSAIAPNGNVAMMSINQEALISTGLGNVSGGAASLVPTWSGEAPTGRALTGQWEVTATNVGSWVAYTNQDETAFLAQITPAGPRYQAQSTDMMHVSAAVVRVGRVKTGAMMGENGGSSVILTTLPNRVQPKDRCL